MCHGEQRAKVKFLREGEAFFSLHLSLSLFFSSVYFSHAPFSLKLARQRETKRIKEPLKRQMRKDERRKQQRIKSSKARTNREQGQGKKRPLSLSHTLALEDVLARSNLSELVSRGPAGSGRPPGSLTVPRTARRGPDPQPSDART